MLKHTPPLDRRKARSTESKNKIARAAEDIVLSQGRAGLTASALAEQAGVSERTVFNHFKKLEDALTYQLSNHLESCLSEPPFPQGLAIEDLPQALVKHFHEAVETQRAQQNLTRFATLGAALVEEEFELVAREVTFTLGAISKALCSEIDQLYPDLSLDQSLALGLFTYNLLMGFAFAFLRLAQEFEDNIFEGAKGPSAIIPEGLLPHIHTYINQVAAGTPVFTLGGSFAAHQTI
ncbi:MAG: TetR/AcrR family transcriptional regulator [Rothia sp. (in: high G+C Gram-positive bacteria)]|nr:TetR/AcrR family transcriptional regulator [Rothia sp. (in: high G+C Gram-positive bacteria)]